MMYCKAGKDRTGILTALLLALAGASDDQIIQDYALCAPVAHRAEPAAVHWGHMLACSLVTLCQRGHSFGMRCEE